jgi:MoaA/NifB/PqqE/SkfB family radical SAM enzyme
MNSPEHLLNLVGDKLRTLPLVVLYLTDGCNSRCITCDIWKNVRRNMSMETVEQIAQDFKRLKVRWVLLSGGEAMQHPEWPAIARRLQAEGAHVMLLTNGLLIKKQIDEVLSSVDEVIVSLDGGTAETYAHIRGVNAFDLVMEGIEMVREGGLPVTTRTTVQRANFREIPHIIDVATAANVNHISFLTVDVSSTIAFGNRIHQDIPPEALTTDEIEELAQIIRTLPANPRLAEAPDKLLRMVDYFKSIIRTGEFAPPRCNAPHISTVIHVDGSLQPCYFLPMAGKINGGLAASINNDELIELRQAYRTGQRRECDHCVCPLYKGPRSLLRM